MGCSSDSTNGSCNAFEAYKYLKSFSIESIKKTLDNTKEKKQIENIFLLLTNSMPNFINIIKQQKKEEDDSVLELEFKKYERDKKIRFLSNFVECWRLAEQDIEKENEFIIVEEPFIKSMNIKCKNLNKMKVKIEFDNKYNKSRNIILFNTSTKIITFEKKQYIFYKFIVNDENKSLMCDSYSSNEEDKMSKIILIDNSINNNDNNNNNNNSNKNNNNNSIKNKNNIKKKKSIKKNNKIKKTLKIKKNKINKSNSELMTNKVLRNNYFNLNSNRLLNKNDNKTKDNNKKNILDKKKAIQNIHYQFPRNTTNFYHQSNANKIIPWKI